MANECIMALEPLLTSEHQQPYWIRLPAQHFSWASLFRKALLIERLLSLRITRCEGNCDFALTVSERAKGKVRSLGANSRPACICCVFTNYFRLWALASYLIEEWDCVKVSISHSTRVHELNLI
jgi:hypothetical protein